MTSLREIVAARLRDLGRNPFEAAKTAGLERTFLNDILIGRKRSVRGDNLAHLADALDWKTTELIERLGDYTYGRSSADAPPHGSMSNERDKSDIATVELSVIRSALAASLKSQGMSTEFAESTAELWIEDAKRRAETENHFRSDPGSKSDGQ